MNKYQTGLVVQGSGILLSVVGLVNVIKAQSLMAVLIVGGVLAFVVGYFMKKDV